MNSKLALKIKQTWHNWWEQFKVFCSLKGYKYYVPPKELKYWYPAPGSCPITPEDWPNWFKTDWKQPFWDSEFNIWKKDKSMEDDESHIAPDFDRLNNDGKFNEENICYPLRTPHKKLPITKYVQLSEDDFILSRETFEREWLENNRDFRLNYNQSHYDELEDTYNPTFMLTHDRTTNSLDNDRWFQNMYLELEYLIENVLLKER